MGRVDRATFDRLLTPEGQGLLADVQERVGIESDLALGSRLRERYDPALVAAAVTQCHLRGRAIVKFGPDAASLYFTHDALEQSTRGAVARHRAARLVASGVRAVLDLGCGIGGDLIACAQAGLRVRGVELDPVRAAIARSNLAALGLPGDVVEADALTVAPRSDEVVFVDPARRDGRGRVTTLDGLVPPWDWVASLLDGPAVAKLMPGVAHDAVPEGVEAEWVSDGGSLVEACLWGRPLAQVDRRATVLPTGATLTARAAVPDTGPPRRYLVEPDDAVIRAGLVAELAEDLAGTLLDPHIAYITTDTAPTGHLGRWFEIVEELPFREKALRAALRERDLGTLTVKKRGVDIVPEHLIARLKARGSTPATLVLTRVDGAGRVFWVRSSESDPSS